MAGTKRKAGYSAVRIVSAKRARSAGVYPQPRLSRARAAHTGEVKFLDSSATKTLVASTDAADGEADPTTLLSISSIAQGDGESNRDGRRCRLLSVQLKGVFRTLNNVGNETAYPPPQRFFVAVVLDTQTNGAQLNSEDVFTNKIGAASNSADVFRNLKFSSRFRVLWQKTITPTAYNTDQNVTTTTDFPPRLNAFSMFKKLDIPVVYSDVEGAIAKVTDNSLHVIAYATDITFGPTLKYNARVRFVG